MILKSSYIYIKNMRFHAYHGVMEQERIVGNDYVLNARLKYDVEKAMTSDDIEDTLNYADVYDILAQEMSVPSNLLERVVGRMGERLFRKYPSIEEMDIDLRKTTPPMSDDSDGAGIEIHLINDKTI